MKRKFKKNVLVTGINQSFINRNPPLPCEPRPERAINRPRIASNQWNFRSIVRRFFQNDESEVDIEAFHEESEDDETEIMVPSYQCLTSRPILHQEGSSDNLLITDDEVSKFCCFAQNDEIQGHQNHTDDLQNQNVFTFFPNDMVTLYDVVF